MLMRGLQQNITSPKTGGRLAALDRLAQHKGFDMTTDSVARAAWERIEKLNLRLAELLEQAKIRLRNQLSSVSQAETQVRFYHS